MKRHLITITAAGGMALTGLAIAQPLHAVAGAPASQWCEDNYGSDDVPLIGPGGVLPGPITLGVHIASPALSGVGLGGPDGSTYVGVCYATSPYGDTGPHLAGGIVQAGTGTAYTWPLVRCVPDSNPAGVAVGCDIGVNAAGNTVLTVAIPFTVCAGQCVSNPGAAPYTTGVIVGTIQQTPPPPGGAGGSYSVSSLCLEVDGQPLGNCATSVAIGGATTTGRPPVNIGTTPPGSPCLLGICVPVNYVGLSGSQLATIFLPGSLGSVPVYGVPFCAYWNNSGAAPTGCTS